MIVVDSAEYFIEDLLMLDREPTLMFRVTDADIPTWEVVFQMGREVVVQRLLQRHEQMLRERLGPVFRIVPRTILYHLSLERFSALAGQRVELVSTNIKNLSQPNPHPIKKYGTLWLGYELDCIAVGRLGIGDLVTLSEQAENVSQLFNATSRYLRIEKLGVAAVENRMGAAPRHIRGKLLIQPPGAGVPTYLLEHFQPASKP